MASAVDRTETGVANLALRFIGETRRLSDVETDATAEAQYARDFLGIARETILSGYDWNFATRRASIAASATAPAFGYDYQYPLPSGCLRVREVVGAGQDYPWTIENDGTQQVLLIDMTSPVNVIYIADVTALAQWSSHGFSAYAAQLAAMMALPLSKDVQIARLIEDQAKRTIERAYELDALESGGVPAFPQGSWITARDATEY